MKRFIINISLFCIPLLVWWFYLFFSDYNQQFAAHFTKGDCFEHGIWLHDRLFLNETNIDIAFIGSSHTLNAIDDRLLSKQTNKNIINLGYCRLGRSLHAFFVHHIQSLEKTPQKIILEIRETEEISSHPMFPYWANSKDLFNMPTSKSYLQDWYLATESRIEYQKSKLYPTIYEVDTTNFGHSSNQDTIETIELNQFKNRHLERLEQHKNSIWQTQFDDFTNRYPKYYLNQIHQTCQSQNIELLFIYLPAFGAINIEPQHLTYYQTMGKVIIPPKEILNNPNYWHDKEHLNIAGSKVLSKFLVNVLQ